MKKKNLTFSIISFIICLILAIVFIIFSFVMAFVGGVLDALAKSGEQNQNVTVDSNNSLLILSLVFLLLCIYMIYGFIINLIGFIRTKKSKSIKVIGILECTTIIGLVNGIYSIKSKE